ncbi:hypothetical protein HT574_10925 [Parageobacillus sp. VR-IP]|nr:hypothetical protein [Parageobacillus sp. VR-IP]
MIRFTIHYSRGYHNVFWNGPQTVYGDRVGQTFLAFFEKKA